jgi:hypothetical protein
MAALAADLGVLRTTVGAAMPSGVDRWPNRALFWLPFTVSCVGGIRALTDPMTIPTVVLLPWTGGLLLFLAAGHPRPVSPRLVGTSAALVLVTSLAVSHRRIDRR